MTATASPIENLTLSITQEIHVRASLEATFAAVLEEIGPYNEGRDGIPMPMKIEPWPGGRWYRDLGPRASHQAAGVARNHGSVVHVVSRGVELAVSA
jgi:hypothetical protein